MLASCRRVLGDHVLGWTLWLHIVTKVLCVGNIAAIHSDNGSSHHPNVSMSDSSGIMNNEVLLLVLVSLDYKLRLVSFNWSPRLFYRKFESSTEYICIRWNILVVRNFELTLCSSPCISCLTAFFASSEFYLGSDFESTSVGNCVAG